MPSLDACPSREINKTPQRAARTDDRPDHAASEYKVPTLTARREPLFPSTSKRTAALLLLQHVQESIWAARTSTFCDNEPQLFLIEQASSHDPQDDALCHVRPN